MPELPDVEAYRRYLDANALHHTIAQVEVESPSVLAQTNPQGLGRKVKGRQFESTRRHGKYLFARLDGGEWLGMHFGMTGKLQYVDDQEAPPKYTRCLIRFDNGYDLAYVSRRKLGRITPLDSVDDFIESHHLGPDALDLSADHFIELARQRKGKIKPWLMDQSVMAGLGNVYSDEALFHAGLHPDCRLNSLDHKQLRALHRAIINVLDAAIKAEADPKRMPRSFLLPHRKAGEDCPKCGGKVESIKAAGRTAWLCPACQSC